MPPLRAAEEDMTTKYNVASYILNQKRNILNQERNIRKKLRKSEYTTNFS